MESTMHDEELYERQTRTIIRIAGGRAFGRRKQTMDEITKQMIGELLDELRGLRIDLAVRDAEPPRNSVEIAVNAKGEKSFKVKAYADTAKKAMLDAQGRVEDMLDYTKKGAGE